MIMAVNVSDNDTLIARMASLGDWPAWNVKTAIASAITDDNRTELVQSGAETTCEQSGNIHWQQDRKVLGSPCRLPNATTNN